MGEPAAIYSSSRQMTFDETISNTQNVILSHARFSLRALADKVDHLRKLVDKSVFAEPMHIENDIPPTLSEIFFHQGIASNILFNDSERGTKENKAVYELRKERVVYVKKKLNGLEVPILSSRKVRNRIEHIDEYLAKHLSDPKIAWFFDSALRVRNYFKAPRGVTFGYCRTYISSEDVLLHFDQELPLGQLKSEALAVHDAVWKGTKPPRSAFSLTKVDAGHPDPNKRAITSKMFDVAFKTRK